MTAREAEQKVRERYPDAVCSKMWGNFTVWSTPSRSLDPGTCLSATSETRADAWKSAALRLTGE